MHWRRVLELLSFTDLPEELIREIALYLGLDPKGVEAAKSVICGQLQRGNVSSGGEQHDYIRYFAKTPIPVTGSYRIHDSPLPPYQTHVISKRVCPANIYYTLGARFEGYWSVPCARIEDPRLEGMRWVRKRKPRGDKGSRWALQKVGEQVKNHWFKKWSMYCRCDKCNTLPILHPNL